MFHITYTTLHYITFYNLLDITLHYITLRYIRLHKAYYVTYATRYKLITVSVNN